MNFTDLSHLAEAPEVHRKVLAGYTGLYSLGVGAAEENKQQPVLILQVEGTPAMTFPRSVSVGGETVMVVVRANTRMPVAL